MVTLAQTPDLKLPRTWALQIAKLQKTTVGLWLAVIPARYVDEHFVAPVLGLSRSTSLVVAVICLQIYSMYRLASAIDTKRHWLWLWSVSVLVPGVNLVTCIVLVEKGRAALEQAGYTPGPLGLGIKEQR